MLPSRLLEQTNFLKNLRTETWKIKWKITISLPNFKKQNSRWTLHPISYFYLVSYRWDRGNILWFSNEWTNNYWKIWHAEVNVLSNSTYLWDHKTSLFFFSTGWISVDVAILPIKEVQELFWNFGDVDGVILNKCRRVYGSTSYLSQVLQEIWWPYTRKKKDIWLTSIGIRCILQVGRAKIKNTSCYTFRNLDF